MKANNNSCNQLESVPLINALQKNSCQFFARLSALKELQHLNLEALRSLDMQKLTNHGKALLISFNERMSSSSHYVKENAMVKVSANLEMLAQLFSSLLLYVQNLKERMGANYQTCLSHFLAKVSERYQSSLVFFQENKNVHLLFSDMTLLATMLWNRMQEKVYQPSIVFLQVQLKECRVLIVTTKESLVQHAVQNYNSLSLENVKGSFNSSLLKSKEHLASLSTEQILSILGKAKEHSLQTLANTKSKSNHLYAQAISQMKSLSEASKSEYSSFMEEFSVARSQLRLRSEPTIEKPVEESNSHGTSEETD